jgi:hypothetical protein
MIALRPKPHATQAAAAQAAAAILLKRRSNA